MTRAVLLTVPLWFVCPALSAQTPPPVIYSTEVSLVEVDAVVTDSEGHVLRELGKDDFELLENGKPQVIDRVSFVEIPIERTGARTAPPRADVHTNLQRFDGRLYVLMLDDVQTSPSRAGRVRVAARRFVSQSLEPGDIAAVVHVSATSGVNQDFTSDRRLLLASIDRFQGRKLRSETLNKIDETNRIRQLLSGAGGGRVSVDLPQGKDPEEAVRAYDARRAFEAIATVSRRLGPVRGRRKSLLWFGEAVAYDMFDLSRTQATAVLESARSAVAAATRANVAIYGVDARGLQGLSEETAQLTGVSINPQEDLAASGLQAELRQSQANLRKVSADTGGFAVVNTDEFAQAFDRVVQENSAYYLLGYYPIAPPGEATYRTIQVKVKRPGVNVRARAGYIPTKIATSAPAGTPSALRDALAGPVPQSGLPMAVHAAAFKGKTNKASVLVTIEYGAAAFETAATSAAGDRLQASVIAVDPLGKVEASDHTSIGLDVKPETRQVMKVLGFRTHARMELPPGRYQLRIAGVLANGLVGSVHHDVAVPDFAATEPTMSDLVLTSIVAGLVPTAQIDERMKQVLPAPPSASRDFRQDEALALFTEIYEGGKVPARDVTFLTTVSGSGGEFAFNRSESRTAEQLKQSNGGYWLQVPLRTLAAGDYTLRVEATAAGAAPMVREAAFRVWDVPATTAAGSEAADPQAGELPFVVVARGAVSGVSQIRQVVARSAGELSGLWESLSLRAAPPAVAFDDTMIAALFLGARPTAGYEAEVVGVRRDGSTLVVSWREKAPQPGNAPAETTPYAIVGLPMHAGEVRFEKVQ